MRGVPILTYHSQNIGGNDDARNDHVALREDLAALHEAGYRIEPLSAAIDWLEGARADDSMQKVVVLTFDDGCDFDVRDLEFPGHGLQRSFLGILEDFRREAGTNAQPALHATTFVIASREARGIIDRGSLFGQDMIRDDWWAETDRGGLIAIESHGWDHNHPNLAGAGRGNFHTVDTHAQCLHQVVQAAGAIEAITGRWPQYFAYPFGESSPYIREVFFPEYIEVHGCRAALGTEPGLVTQSSDRWNLPRFVCRRDWKSADGLLSLIA